MPTVTANAPAHDPPTGPTRKSRLSALSIVVASLGTLVIAFFLYQARSSAPTQMQSVPAQPPTVSQWVTTTPKPLPAPAPPRPQAAAPATDSQGFVDSPARCDTTQRAVAIARTERSAIVVCETAAGDYSYRGVRLQDGASLRLDDVRPIPAGFEARNDGTTYRLSPTELVVIAGETLQSRDPVVEYRAG
ncbi:hypothetical protein [Mycolicibacterium chlorophenolicum]|uniref:Uncharacterized protein n=1 Tax=Mycolicibacterium chlorophenolicum TaxID=37916 RepID=A0A0J6VCV4_9MYCO|nr:hypothetical protein [Mycolicibacterium chlorophenolicum]KMO67358.1 hypothetical protein MCHLDSM_06607 [Mycolicibacterium chlorophenolicum]